MITLRFNWKSGAESKQHHFYGGISLFAQTFLGLFYGLTFPREDLFNQLIGELAETGYRTAFHFLVPGYDRILDLFVSTHNTVFDGLVSFPNIDFRQIRLVLHGFDHILHVTALTDLLTGGVDRMAHQAVPQQHRKVVGTRQIGAMLQPAVVRGSQSINYLNNPDVYKLGEKVIVIGAGNAAMDVARTALRKGTRYLTCFSITEKVAASEHEFSYAQLEGVEFQFSKRPLEITDDGVIFIDVIQNEDGSFTDIEGTEKLYPSDNVMISISQGPANKLMNTTKGLKANDRGLIATDEEGHTSIPGVFASGDVVKGARTVVEAVKYSKIVAEAMDEYMQNLPKDNA